MPDARLEQEILLMHNRVCYGVADPKRVLLLYALEKGPKCVSDLVEELRMSQPAVSRHLRVLRERNLVSIERRGPSSYYSLADHRVLDAMNLLREVLRSQLASERKTVRSGR